MAEQAERNAIERGPGRALSKMRHCPPHDAPIQAYPIGRLVARPQATARAAANMQLQAPHRLLEILVVGIILEADEAVVPHQVRMTAHKASQVISIPYVIYESKITKIQGGSKIQSRVIANPPV